MKKIRRALALLLTAALLLAAAGCQKEVTAEDLMANITAGNASEMDPNQKFCQDYARIAFTMLGNAYSKDGGNVVFSPLSVMYHLGLLYNGTEGNTADELNELFSKNNVNPEEFNIHLHSYLEKLKDTDLSTFYFKNAIWFNSDKNATPTQAFLQTAADYYGPAAYKESFGPDAVTNINNWISNSTNMDIEYILNEMPADAPMVLLSAAMMNANWASPYPYGSIQDGVFTNAAGGEEKAQMMSALETQYLSDGEAKGFIKPYSGGNYAFVGILPKHEDITGYVTSMNVSGRYDNIIKPLYKQVADVTIPKFSCEYTGGMSEMLGTVGVSRIFNAGYSQLGGMGTADGNLYAGDLFVRTGMSVTEKGTSKGTGMSSSSTDTATDVHAVQMNRPFIFMVIDTRYNLPLIVGAVNTLAK